MSDDDPTLKFLNSGGSSSSSSSSGAQDPTLSFLSSGGKMEAASAAPRTPQAPSPGKPPPMEGTWGEALVGDLDIAHALAAHAVIDPVAAAARILNEWIPGGDVSGDINAVQETANKYLGTPWTKAGQYGMEQLGKVVGPVVGGVKQGLTAAVGPEWTHAIGEVSQAIPVIGMAPSIARAARATAQGVAAPGRAVGRAWRAAVEAGTPTAQDIMNRAASEQSAGAAGAGIPMSQTSQAFQREVQDTFRYRGYVNPVAAARQAEAESIGVRLSEGQALQDQARISAELNGRARNPEHAQFFQWQNSRLKAFVNRLRDEVMDATGARAANQAEHGEALIAHYQDLDDAARAHVDALYSRLRDAYAQYLANGGREMALDGRGLLDNVRHALKEGIVDPETGERLGGMLTNHAPGGIMADLADWAEHGMSFESYEAMRTNLARLMRSPNVNPLERASAHVIRAVMEDMPLAQDIAGLKDLADEARAAARARFARIEADPAYEAVVSGTANPATFTRSFLLGPRVTRDGLQQMLSNFADNEVARGHITLSALDHLREKAGVDWQGNGTFSQAGFNRGLTALDPVRNQLFGPSMQEYLQRLGNVSGYMQRLERGNFVNHSNTWTAAAGAGAADALETLANAKTGGVAGWLLDRGRETRRAAEARRVIRPGAGIDIPHEARPVEADITLPENIGAPPRPRPGGPAGGPGGGGRGGGGSPPPRGGAPAGGAPGGSQPSPGPRGAPPAPEPGPSAGPAPERRSILEGLSWSTPARTRAEHTRRLQQAAEQVPELGQAVGPRPPPAPPRTIADVMRRNPRAIEERTPVSPGNNTGGSRPPTPPPATGAKRSAADVRNIAKQHGLDLSNPSVEKALANGADPAVLKILQGRWGAGRPATIAELAQRWGVKPKK